jgi:hypothetical protein
LITSGVTIDNVVLPLGTGGTYNPIFEFETGNAQFRTDNGLTGTDYEKIYARKFTFTYMVVLMGGMFIVQVEQIKIHYIVNGARVLVVEFLVLFLIKH